jgi:glycosyltransferase involved in cell wall biosynthesis
MNTNSNNFPGRIQVSVIIPNYNYSHYIEQCLQSVLDSNFKSDKMEIILVDDASTDNSVEVIEEMMKSCPFPFRLIKNDTNLGLSLTRNRGITNANGELLFFWTRIIIFATIALRFMPLCCNKTLML